MAQDYNEYLAVNVINEQKLVSFRSVSRALKVHANLAKQMLYDFHDRQNSKKPGSVHATYLITGTKLSPQTNGTQPQNGEDSVMQSDPAYPSSSMPEQDESAADTTPVRSITLVKEEHLEHAKATFQHIVGMHIYSLQASGLSDLQTLAECNRSLAATHASEDPLKARKQYGTIQNPHVRRRTGKTPQPPPAPAPTQQPKPRATAPSAPKPTTSSSAKSQPAPRPAPSSQESRPEPPAPAKPTSSKPGSVKRQDSSLFKSFAKASASKPKNPAAVDSEASAAPTPEAASQDASMTGFSDDDDDDEDGEEGDGSGLPEELRDVRASGGKSRKEREAELQAMMDREDEEMVDADADVAVEADDEGGEKGEGGEEDGDGGEGGGGEVEAEDAGAIDGARGASRSTEQQENVRVENGRRRGRRRVMKKRTVKDEEGYLVTKEEPAWESFSEEEPAPKKPKVEVAAATAGSSSSGAKGGGKKAAKVGQGNIMSFFAKR